MLAMIAASPPVVMPEAKMLRIASGAFCNTSGISFQAAEGGEEDIRLRGFSLASTGDNFVGGLRDPAF